MYRKIAYLCYIFHYPLVVVVVVDDMTIWNMRILGAV